MKKTILILLMTFSLVSIKAQMIPTTTNSSFNCDPKATIFYFPGLTEGNKVEMLTCARHFYDFHYSNHSNMMETEDAIIEMDRIVTDLLLVPGSTDCFPEGPCFTGTGVVGGGLAVPNDVLFSLNFRWNDMGMEGVEGHGVFFDFENEVEGVDQTSGAGASFLVQNSIRGKFYAIYVDCPTSRSTYDIIIIEDKDLNFAECGGQEMPRLVQAEEEKSTVQALTVFPNPAQGDFAQLTYELNRDTESTIQLLSNTGQVVDIIADRQMMSSGIHQFNLQGYGSGLYFIQVKTADQLIVKKWLNL